jgi:hypothetical protein
MLMRRIEAIPPAASASTEQLLADNSASTDELRDDTNASTEHFLDGNSKRAGKQQPAPPFTLKEPVG